MSNDALTTAVNLAKQFEGCKLAPYLDTGGVPTIGWGTTYLLDGSRVTMKTPELTQDEADSILAQKMQECINDVMHLVHVPLNPNQIAALADFCYNLGSHALLGSTLLHFLNGSLYVAAANQFEVWSKGRVNGTLQTLPGLLRRRTAEQGLFVLSYYQS
jgi:lysozyme